MLLWKPRLRAAAIHLGLSLIVAALAAWLVFGLWYPYPYREISGGRELFPLVVSVDVVLGPLITLLIFDVRKSRASLTRDLAAVGALQLAALCYGLWTVSAARPVHLVFEVDRFRPVHAIEVDVAKLPQAPEGLRELSLLRGPTLLAVRPFRDSSERADAVMLEMQGLALGMRPEFWMDYAQARPAVLKAAKPVTELKARKPALAAAIDAVATAHGLSPATALYLPVAGRADVWTALLDPADLRPVAFLPLDPYE